MVLYHEFDFMYVQYFGSNFAFLLIKFLLVYGFHILIRDYNNDLQNMHG